MQSSGNENLTDNGDKSLHEWPTLNDVCSNDTGPSQIPLSVTNEKSHRKRNKAHVKESGGYDSSKENEVDSQSSSGRGARRKASSKTKWVPVPIVSQPYKKRGNGRQYFDPNRTNHNERQNESYEYANGSENGRGYYRGNTRYRGKRSRVYSNWRPRREESSRGEVKNSSDITYETDYYYNTTYYDPYLHNVYATVIRDEGLKNAIKHQIEYYFSDDNLIKDTFIRRNMDSQGYVPLTVIASFPRVLGLTSTLTNSLEVIAESLKDSSKLELVDNVKVRPVVDPLKWPVVDVQLRTDVPEFIPGQPYINDIITAMNNLNCNVNINIDNFSGTPDSASLSSVGSEMAVSYFPENETPPEHINSYVDDSVVPYVANDIYSNSASPDEPFNGVFFDEPVSNGVLYYTASVNTSEQASNGESFYYGSSTDEVLSSETDNSAEDHQTVLDAKSPEPSR